MLFNINKKILMIKNYYGIFLGWLFNLKVVIILSFIINVFRVFVIILCYLGFFLWLKRFIKFCICICLLYVCWYICTEEFFFITRCQDFNDLEVQNELVTKSKVFLDKIISLFNTSFDVNQLFFQYESRVFKVGKLYYLENCKNPNENFLNMMGSLFINDIYFLIPELFFF